MTSWRWVNPQAPETRRKAALHRGAAPGILRFSLQHADSAPGCLLSEGDAGICLGREKAVDLNRRHSKSMVSGRWNWSGGSPLNALTQPIRRLERVANPSRCKYWGIV
jgi:hypothetical protein